jgi:hypothetical protein
LHTESIKIIVRYADGRTIKGYTQDFFPNKSLFHLHLLDSSPTIESAEILLQDLKAVFFVRDFKGNPEYKESKVFAEEKRPAGRMVEVTFKDDEVLVGTTLGYDPKRSGFFLFPADPESNNLRVFAVSKAVKKIQLK